MMQSDRIVAKREVVSRSVGDEVVLLDLSSGTYFGLDPIGSRFWQLADSGKSLSEICDALIEEYEVRREQLEGDILVLVSELVAANLASVVSPERDGV